MCLDSRYPFDHTIWFKWTSFSDACFDVLSKFSLCDFVGVSVKYMMNGLLMKRKSVKQSVYLKDLLLTIQMQEKYVIFTIYYY